MKSTGTASKKVHSGGPSQSLEAAWTLRSQFHFSASPETECLRMYHGPGEAISSEPEWLSQVSLDQFGPYVWVTVWEGRARVGESELRVLRDFLSQKGLKGAVVLDRPKQGVPHEPTVLFGEVPTGRKVWRELGCEYQIQLLGAKHPGLFLDHVELRRWLLRHAQDQRVLNTFSYTGSLSIAAAVGGAKEVHTLDLSRPTIEWAKENWELNRSRMRSPEGGKFWVADFFEWKAKQTLFDIVILDPPSFSRGERKTFSTSKDLVDLHARAFRALDPQGGIVITSINSANVSSEKFRSELLEASRLEKRAHIRILKTIEQPESFATSALGSSAQFSQSRYLKGWWIAVGPVAGLREARS